MNRAKLASRAALVVGFVIGIILITAGLHEAKGATLPPCNTGARILCGVKPLPKHPVSKPVKVRKSGPIFRG